MSLAGSPGHSNGAYESYYDSDFSAAISARMHVPDKIRLAEGIEATPRIAPPMEVKSMMYVPDRILVAGNNQHIAVRESIPELKFDSSLSLPQQSYVLTAPPNVLTVDEYPYPSVEFESSKPDNQKKVILDQSLNRVADLNETTLNTSCAPEEEVAILRRQVRNLSRRVLTIEQENQQRQQREIILYALGVTYFLFKGLFWLHRHF